MSSTSHRVWNNSSKGPTRVSQDGTHIGRTILVSEHGIPLNYADRRQHGSVVSRSPEVGALGFGKTWQRRVHLSLTGSDGAGLSGDMQPSLFPQHQGQPSADSSCLQPPALAHHHHTNVVGASFSPPSPLVGVYAGLIYMLKRGFDTLMSPVTAPLISQRCSVQQQRLC